MARRRRNVAAFERSLVALRKAGRVEAVDGAMVALGRTLAELLDDPDEPLVTAAWCYKSVLEALRGEVAGAARDDDLAAALAALSAQMGDAPES